MRATRVPALRQGRGMELLTGEVMTEASLLTGGTPYLPRGRHRVCHYRHTPAGSIWSCDHTVTSEAGSDVMQFRLMWLLQSSTIKYYWTQSKNVLSEKWSCDIYCVSILIDCNHWSAELFILYPHFNHQIKSVNHLIEHRVGSKTGKHLCDHRNRLIKVWHFWEIRLFAFLPRVRWQDWYHSHVCMLNMKLELATG